MKKIIYSITLFLLTLNTIYATVYNVGPGQSLSSLDQVPWSTLKAGDIVNIYYKSTPYRTKIGLRGRGTLQNPIIIRGISGPNGEQPILSGKNATTPANLNGFFNARYNENLGVIIIRRLPGTDPIGYKPAHIIIENLKITGASSRFSYTNMAGKVVKYARAAAAISVRLGENITIRNCEITDNGNGLFVRSSGDASPTGESVSSDILIEHNRIHDNGERDIESPGNNDRQHGIYTEAAGMIIQYNDFGNMLPRSGGSALKDRSSGCIIRYNKIQAGARALDLVDPEDAYGYIPQQPDFHDTYVYGNIFINDKTDTEHVSAGILVHYGGDSGGENSKYREGTLHFYNNTVVITSNARIAYRVRLFDLSTNKESVELRNNIFYLKGDSNFYMMRDYGIANVKEGNWINTGWQHGGRSGTFGGSIHIDAGALIEGTDPKFVNLANENFHLKSDSPCIDKGVNSFAGGVSIDKMYKEIANFETRTIKGNKIDLGAYEGTGGTSGCSATLPTFSLPNNSWRLIALPGTPPNGKNSINAIFGDDIPGNYGEDWELFSYNSNTGKYNTLTKSSTLSPGVGYWILQTSGSTKTLDMPAGSCPISNQTVPLVSKSGKQTWNMIGNSLTKDTNIRVYTNNGACKTGCNLEQANTDKVTADIAFGYNGTAYVEYKKNSTIAPWTAVWIQTLENASNRGGASIKFSPIAGKALPQKSEVLATSYIGPQPPEASIDQSAIHVYPNPTNDNATVVLPVVENGWNYQVISITGQVVQSGKMTTATNTLHLTGVERGVYFLQVTSNGKIEVIKVVKQ